MTAKTKKNPMELGDKVTIAISGETGTVEGLVTYRNSKAQALVYYEAADGRAVQDWCYLSQLKIAK